MRYARFLGLGALGAALLGCSSDAVPPPSVSSGGTLGAGGSAGGPSGGAGASGSASTGGSTAGGGGTGAGGSQAGTASGGTTSGGTGAGGSGGATTGGSAGTSSGGSAGNGGSAGTGGSGGAPVLEPCSAPSVSRLKVWEMQVVGGTQVPANGSPLRKYDGGGYELYVEWTLTQGGAYGTANAPINNQGQYTNGADPAKNAIDISKGAGLTIEYASTGNTYMQIRTGTVPHGGDHFRADLPSTNGMLKTIELKYADFRRPGGATPPGDDVLKDAFSFTFVGGGSTKLTLRQVRIPGFVPPCD